ncbi:MAG: rhodanese-related sulfurtransferase [Myxococcota bacterium]
MIRRVAKLGRGLARFALREFKERTDRRGQEPNAPVPANREAGETGQGDSAPQLAPARTMLVQDIDQGLESGDLVLLDCREIHEWEAGYISPSVHIPMADLEDRVGELDATARTVVYCLHGMRSAEVAHWLTNKHGFADVSSMDGGIVAWYSDFDQARIVVSRSEDH